MKTQKIIGMLLLFLAFSFISCDKDEAENVSFLTGRWAVKEPVVEIDAVIYYTFKADKTCEVFIVGPAINSMVSHLTYEISEDNKLITLYDKGADYTERYEILKLTNDEMQWKNATPEDGNSDKRLEKVEW